MKQEVKAKSAIMSRAFNTTRNDSSCWHIIRKNSMQWITGEMLKSPIFYGIQPQNNLGIQKNRHKLDKCVSFTRENLHFKAFGFCHSEPVAARKFCIGLWLSNLENWLGHA